MKPFPLGSAAALTVALICGLDRPSEAPRTWPRAGFIDPGKSVRINAVCSEEYIRVRAWVDAPGFSEDRWLAGRKRLVEGREEIIRLREPP